MNPRVSNRPAENPMRPLASPSVDAPTVTRIPRGDGKPLSWRYFAILSALVVAATLYGLVDKDAYRLVSAMTEQTWRAQDAVSLALVPVLLSSSRRARRGH